MKKLPGAQVVQGGHIARVQRNFFNWLCCFSCSKGKKRVSHTTRDTKAKPNQVNGFKSLLSLGDMADTELSNLQHCTTLHCIAMGGKAEGESW